jgi:quercetin dioxygenase-like cupin family protein
VYLTEKEIFFKSRRPVYGGKDKKCHEEKMSGQKEREDVLDSCIGKPQRLAQLIVYSEDSIVSKTILDKSAGTVTLFAFDKGQRLSEHTVPYDAIVQIIDGKAHIAIAGQGKVVSNGQIIIMPANVPHAVAAKERFKMVLVIIREHN